MTEKEIRDYQTSNPVYYPTVSTLKTKCPVNYDWNKCSSKEYGTSCRTCANYNPLRMLYEKESSSVYFGVPMVVLLADAKIQLDCS